MARASRSGGAEGAILIAGIVLAALTEAIASTALSAGRFDIIGDIHATPDEFAWLDIGYTTAKFIGFVVAPVLMCRIDSRRLLIGSTLVLGAAGAIAMLATSLDTLVALRVLQGLSGGILLVGSQSILFLEFPRSRQPVLQALFAIGAVVAPATMTAAYQGWLVDYRSWGWIFFSIVPVSLASAGLLLMGGESAGSARETRPFDWLGAALFSVSLCCFTYVLSQGNRWNWFGDPIVSWLVVAGSAALLAFLGTQVLSGERRLLQFEIFESEQFSFAFFISFIAGAALFGSAYLIPAFAASVLSFTPTGAGLLLLPSGGLFLGALFLAAFLFQVRGAPPIATVPFGIILIMTSMWMLSGSTQDSGTGDMMTAILLRGVGLGFLFLSITLIAFSDLNARDLPFGIALFNIGRQLGGLLGVAGLQTLISHGVVTNMAVLGAGVSDGSPLAQQRLAATAAAFAGRGLDTEVASQASRRLLGSAVQGQSAVIAFETAFNAVALFFVFAVPAVIAVKIALSRQAKKRAARVRSQEVGDDGSGSGS
ncbi:MFS transporter [Hyphomonas johnsonii]|uniref:EmrB/QacA subfamily drug resistance transporter n=1 Tax=Hyphomonas johnsonii MHS-2 TaxID=1280950 RepID=A0A059FUI9_9PROT|nr:EmrB/QacA subfamily drug resistance transporter [Hyphomonas johnsonii MHS-2]